MSDARRPLSRALLAAMVGLHVLLGLGFGFNTPLFESPDEPGHYLFVRFLQAYGQLPVQTAEFMAARAHHPPGYYALVAALSNWVKVPGSPTAIQMQVNPKFGFRAADPGNDNKAFYVHNGPEERWPYQGQALVAHLARLVSLLLSTLAVLATYGAARELCPRDDVLALFSAGLVALNPMVLFMSGLVNNDTSALASGAGVIFLLTRFLRRGFTLRRWAVVGVALGIGLLLKASALVLIAPTAVALLYDTWQGKSWRRLLLGGLGVAAPAAALAGWWFARNVALYGDPLGNAAVLLVNGRVPDAERLTVVFGHLAWFFEGVVGCGPIGPLSLCFPTWIYGATGIVLLAAIAGGLAWLRARWPRRRDLARASSTAGWAAHGLLILGTFAAATAYGLDCNNCFQGRFMLPAYASLALFLAAGLLAWFPARWRPLVTGAILLASLSLSAYALFGMIIPRYGTPPSPSSGELRQATPLDAQIGDVARVLAYRVDAGAAHPGGMVAVTVYWQVLAPTAAPYTVFINLYSAHGGSVAQRDTYPGLGNYATTGWDPGRTFVDTYRLYLPDDAPLVDHAMILLGLYDAGSGERLSVTGKDAGPAEDAWVQFGDVSVTPPAAPGR